MVLAAGLKRLACAQVTHDAEPRLASWPRSGREMSGCSVAFAQRKWGAEISRAETTIFLSSFNLISPVQPSAQKYFSSVFQKYMFLSRHPDSPGGAARDRHGRWKQDAVAVRVCGALYARRRKQLHGRRNRVVPIPRRWDQAL